MGGTEADVVEASMGSQGSVKAMVSDVLSKRVIRKTQREIWGMDR